MSVLMRVHNMQTSTDAGMMPTSSTQIGGNPFSHVFWLVERRMQFTNLSLTFSHWQVV